MFLTRHGPMAYSGETLVCSQPENSRQQTYVQHRAPARRRIQRINMC